MRIARVFPRRTNATPIDALAFTSGPGLFPPEVDEVHVSVTFTWELPEAERLAREWERVAPVQIGGPATGMRGGDFEPGRYLKPGYVITSRGCPNRCWFCSVPKREGELRELPIRDGCNLLDDNLLACSDDHIRAVFAMLKRQPNRAQFTGGLEAARLEEWHAREIIALHPEVAFFAYDAPDDWPHLQRAAEMMIDCGMPTAGHRLRAYVLCGFARDTHEAAEQRMRAVCSLGVTPMAMLWRNRDGKTDYAWRRFQRRWARPAIIHAGEEG